jgi:hypothetical protein
MARISCFIIEWGPKGIDIPSIKKYQNMDLSAEKGA